jgi:hypothetical protein
MKLPVFLSCIFLLTVSARNCNNNSSIKNEEKPDSSVAKSADSASVKKYKGKLEIKAICMNYTLRLVEGNIDTTLISGNWMDETTHKSYQNVFALGNPCTFPATIEQGQDFNFVIDTASPQKQCAVCMAYYPTPPKKLFIKVVE